MGLFSGSSTTTVTPIPSLFDAGIFTTKGSGAFGAGTDDPNQRARELATRFQDTLLQSQFFQNPEQLNALIQRITSGQSLISPNFRKSILDASQGQFNKRGIGRITENEALQALAPFELQARDTATRALGGLTTARGFDFTKLLELAQLARPDLLVGSSTTAKSSPSGITSLASILELGKSVAGLFPAGGGSGGGISPFPGSGASKAFGPGF